MNRPSSSHGHSAALGITFATMVSASALAQSVPNLVNYQGRLTDPTGAPLASASYGIQFRLWDSPTNTASGGLIWGQQQNVAVQANGVFNVILGAPGGSAILGAATNDLKFAFASSNRFLGVTIVSSNGTPQADGEILPRQQLLSAPFALMSAQVSPATITASNLSPQLALDAIVPPGTIVAYGGETIPAGWLACDGSMQLISAYPRLSQAIGVRWGTNSATQFRLPDLRGVFLRGVSGNRNDGFQDPGDGRVGLFGGGAGQGVGSFQNDQLKSHTHNILRAQPVGGGDNQNWIVADNYNTGRNSDFPGVINPSGGTESRPKNAYVNYIIKY